MRKQIYWKATAQRARKMSDAIWIERIDERVAQTPGGSGAKQGRASGWSSRNNLTKAFLGAASFELPWALHGFLLFGVLLMNPGLLCMLHYLFLQWSSADLENAPDWEAVYSRLEEQHLFLGRCLGQLFRPVSCI